mgnify:CR=1 FL=1
MVFSSKPGRSAAARLAFLMALCLAAGLFAVVLNARYYVRNQPFFDSMSYHTQVHRVMTQSRTEGVIPALGTACRSSTVCLPLVFAALAGPFIAPSRSFGIAIQTVELAVLCGSLWYYLHHVRGLAAALATLAVAPCLLWRCLYDFSGGLSDFRMDLSLALLFATAVIWYLIAMATGRLGHFIALGVATAVTCLFRATAPVYLAVTLVPLACIDLWPQATRPRRFLGLALAAVTAAAGCLWFFVLNYDALHYYYVVWNTDANARLPLGKAARHAAFAVGHIGVPAALFAISIPLVLHADAWLGRDPAGRRSPGRPWREFLLPDWRMAWIGIAPVLLLVARGAGLNPYVSMPAAFGLTLVLLGVGGGPASRAIYGRQPSRGAVLALAGIAVACTAISTTLGWISHHGGGIDSMAAHRQAVDAIVADARRVGRDQVRYGATHCYFLNQASLESVMLFDHPRTTRDGGTVRIDGVALKPDETLAIWAEADLERVPGDTAADKLEHAIAAANRDVDYLAIPDEATSRFVEDHLSYYVINRSAVFVRERLLASGDWEPVSDAIRNGTDEVVHVYRNASRMRTAVR